MHTINGFVTSFTFAVANAVMFAVMAYFNQTIELKKIFVSMGALGRTKGKVEGISHKIQDINNAKSANDRI
jgi:hypothetical protein